MKRLFAVITRLSLRFRWITILIVVVFLGLGVLAASKMNQELLPPIELPQTYIFALQPGASSEDLRDLVTIPLEKGIVGIKGVVPEGLQSTTTSPVAFLSVVNESGVDRTALNKQIQTVIDNVVAAGVPRGLKTTADLTPDIIKKVLTIAPSMFKHFESRHLVALQPEVLDAAFSLNPDFVKSLDPLTRDQIAAERVSIALSGTTPERKPVELPGAWIITDDKLPQIRTFSLSSLPVITASISSDKLTPEELRALVDTEIVKGLPQQVPDVANVSVPGGQQIPAEVLAAAQAAVERANKSASQPDTQPAAQATAAATTAATAQPTAQATAAATTATTTGGTTGSGSNTPQKTPAPANQAPTVNADGVPLVPGSWRSFVIVPILNGLLHTPINNADDLLNTKDASGSKQTAAQALNAVSEKNGNLVRDLPPAVLTYLKDKEGDFAAKLSPKTQAALSADALAAVTGEKPAPALGSAWTQLASQPSFKAAQLASVKDLLYLPGGAAATLNSIVVKTPASLQNFAISVLSSLSPDAIAYLIGNEKDFLSKLDPQVLHYLSAETLKSLPADFISGLKDDKLKADLQAIIADPSKAAAASIQDTSVAAVVDDPNAPLLPETWTTQLKSFGITKTDDLLRHPFGLPSAGAFMNVLGARGGTSFMAPLSADVLLYLQSKEKTFFATLEPATLGLFSKEILAKLPPEVSARAETGAAFTPTTTVTRTNSAESLSVSVVKNDGANTVAVADAIQEVFTKITAKHPDVHISTTFEQASFIKESISGVAREGGLGAVMAVLVILLFLNFSFRSTLVTAVSIPTSVGIAFVLLYLLPRTVHPLLVDLGARGILPETLLTVLVRLFPANITLNIMTLSGLTVAIGRVVDDSIVVLENIYRQIQTGMNPRDAVLKGTRDVSLAIFAATLTTVVVFLPIGLTGGVIGEFFLPFGLAVTYSLIASFIVAITIVPLLAYIFIRQKDVPEEKEGRLEKVYHGAIIWALDHRWIVLGLAMVTLVIGLGLFGTRPTTFLPAFGEPQVSVAVNMPNGTTLAQTDVRVRQLEDYLKTLLGKGVAKYQIVVGGGGGLAALVGGGGVSGNAATITIAPNTKNADQLTQLTADIRAKAEVIFADRKNVKVSKASLSEQGFGGFAVVMSGPADKLQAVNDKVIKTLSTVPGLANVTSTLSQASASTSTTYLRINQVPAVQFSAELETSNTLGATRDAIKAVQALPDLPKDVTIGEGYQSQQQTQGFAQTFGSLGLAIVIVYIVMVITFSSLVHPFTILFSLPLAVVGAALGLTITNRVLGISALIGLLMLVGIVVTNAIVLIDRVQQNRKEKGESAHDALVEAGQTRLRPILMTAIATMIALLPLAIGLSEGAIIASELGTVVIGGLFSSTLLTLLVVPVVYSLLNAAQRIILRRPETTPAKAASGD